MEIKRLYLLFVCIFLSIFFVSCNVNDTSAQSEGCDNITEKVNEVINVYDAFDISAENRKALEHNLYYTYKTNAELQLKFYEIGIDDLCEYLPNMNVEDMLENSKHTIGYYADVSDNIYGELAGCHLRFKDEQNDEINAVLTSKKNRTACWEMVYEYICDPYKVFSKDIQIENAYCFTFRTPYCPSIAEKDLIVYYETDKGRYILYRPFEFEPNDVKLPIYEDGNAIPVGYSDTLYFFPIEVLSQCNEYIQERISNRSNYSPTLALYYGECQIHRIIDLEPYKFVPGQLPK